MYSENTVKLRQCQNWFAKFRFGDFDVKEAPRSGRPIEVDDDKIKVLIESNRCLTTQEIAENLKMTKSSVEKNYLKQFGYISNRKKCNYFLANLIFYFEFYYQRITVQESGLKLVKRLGMLAKQLSMIRSYQFCYYLWI